MCKTELHSRTVLSAIVFALLAGCGGGGGGGPGSDDPDRPVAEFQFALLANAVRPGESLQLRMIIQDSELNDLRRTVTFVSSKPEVASISAGRLTALQVGSTEIRATIQEGGSERLALTHVFVQQPVRNKIAFIRTPGPFGGVADIFLMNPDGSDQQLTVPSALERCSPSDGINKCPTPWHRPSWHPDGMRLATSRIVILHPELFGRMIFLCSTAHPECDALRPYPTEVVNGGVVPLFGTYPAWSPQGERLAFSTRTWNPVEHAFTQAPSADELSWSPDGNRVAYVQFSSTTDVWIKNVDDSGPIRVTDNAMDDRNPAWSPDGTTIAFATNRDGNYEIYLYNVGTGSVMNLTQHAGDDRWPTWSPDGTRIAFQSNRDGNEEIYSMSVDGSDQVNLTNYFGADVEPAWSRN